MVITSTEQKGKSVISQYLYIQYNIGRNGGNEMRELHGVVYKDDRNVGYLSNDFIRSGFQFSLNSDSDLTAQEKKQLFDAFVDDIEQLSSDTETLET